MQLSISKNYAVTQNLTKTKLIVDGNTLENKDRIFLRRNSVGLTTKNGQWIFDDNIYNRILLGMNVDEYIKSPRSPVSPQVPREARPYQKADIEAMISHRWTLNRNKPGYGKTFETIAYCRMMGFKRILIICPKSVISQWIEQFHKWWSGLEETLICESGGLGPSKKDNIIYVTNYESLVGRKMRGAREEKPSQVKLHCKQFVWDIIVCDESHRIKNPKSKVTCAVKELPALQKMPLTGTPILSRPSDLWSQLHFMDERLSGRDYWAFVNRFCEVEDGAFGRQILGLTPSDTAKQLLAQALSMISVGGENHAVTSGKNIIPINLDWDKEQRKMYKAIVDLSMDYLDDKGITVKNAMDQIIKQQQATTNPGMLGVKANPKFEWIKDWLEDNEDEKVVIYSKWKSVLDALQEYLWKAKIGTAPTVYSGACSEKQRDAIKEVFIRDKESRCLLGTIGALGTGVDGLQQVCRNVIFLDRDYTPGNNEQAEDRVNRSGQVGMTNIWILYMRKSIDEHVEGIQSKKAEDIKELFKYVRDSFGSGE